jgi:hypothetical protein
MLVLLFVVASFEGWFLSPGNWESMVFWGTIGILLARPAPSAVPMRAPDRPPPALAFGTGPAAAKGTA